MSLYLIGPIVFAMIILIIAIVLIALGMSEERHR